MNLLVFHIVSGESFFSGVLLVIVAMLASLSSRPTVVRVGLLALLVGGIAIAVSSTPLPYAFYAAALVMTFAGLVSRSRRSWRRWAVPSTIAVWCAAILIEIPQHLSPAIQPVSSRNLAIVGDSVTAGIGGDEASETWPSLLARQHRLQVQDISHMGETASSALKRVRAVAISAPLVIIEIGGNDLLGSTTTSQFSQDLDALVSFLAVEGRQLVMFELPLPPFCHEYGRVQRLVAARHGVKLIPKRVLLSVISGSESTLDTIHLSQAGHQGLADRVWRVIEPAYRASEPDSAESSPKP